MVMRVNKSWANDLLMEIKRSSLRRLDVVADLRDFIAFDEDVRLHGFDVLVAIMYQSSTTFQQYLRHRVINESL